MTSSDIKTLESLLTTANTILTDEVAATGRFLSQHQSPLFSCLPRELRDLIWSFATAPYQKPNIPPFDTRSYYYRPGHTAHLKTDTNLLFTCRRIWLEANALPMLQAEHTFYYHRKAPDARTRNWMARLTMQNLVNLGHLRLFVQMYMIEGLTARKGALRRKFLRTPVVPGDFAPRLFCVTIRHTDWWYWEDDAALDLKMDWVQALLDSPDLRSTRILELELETLDYKVGQLEGIVEKIRSLESKVLETHYICEDGGDDNVNEIEGEKSEGKTRTILKTQFVLSPHLTTTTWSGPTDIDRSKYHPYEAKTQLKYHVVKLSWRLVFADLPYLTPAQLPRAKRLEFVAKQLRLGDQQQYNNQIEFDDAMDYQIRADRDAGYDEHDSSDDCEYYDDEDYDSDINSDGHDDDDDDHESQQHQQRWQ